MIISFMCTPPQCQQTTRVHARVPDAYQWRLYIANIMLVVGLLVIDAVPQSAIWREWAKGHEDTVRFVIHAKVPEAPALVGDP